MKILTKSGHIQNVSEEVGRISMKFFGARPHGKSIPVPRELIIPKDEDEEAKDLSHGVPFTGDVDRWNILPEYEAMTVRQLREVAKNSGINGYGSMNKENLIKELTDVSTDQ